MAFDVQRSTLEYCVILGYVMVPAVAHTLEKCLNVARRTSPKIIHASCPPTRPEVWS